MKIHFSIFVSFENFKKSARFLCKWLFCSFNPTFSEYQLLPAISQKWYIFTPGALARTAETCHINQQNGSFGPKIFQFFSLLPRNSTWNLKMMVSKRNHLFQWLLFRFHVKFQGCIFPGLHAFKVWQIFQVKTEQKLENFCTQKNLHRCVCFPMESPRKIWGILQILSRPTTPGKTPAPQNEQPGEAMPWRNAWQPVEDQKILGRVRRKWDSH